MIKPAKEYQLGALYLCAMDADTRNAYRYGSVGNKFLADVDRAQNMKELLSVAMKLDRTYGIGNLFSAGYGVDTKNVDEKVLYCRRAPLLSKEYWFGGGMITAFLSGRRPGALYPHRIR